MEKVRVKNGIEREREVKKVIFAEPRHNIVRVIRGEKEVREEETNYDSILCLS